MIEESDADYTEIFSAEPKDGLVSTSCASMFSLIIHVWGFGGAEF